jgi:hypothetical protein
MSYLLIAYRLSRICGKQKQQSNNGRPGLHLDTHHDPEYHTTID